MKKNIVKAVTFLVLLCAVIGYINAGLKFKYGDGIYNLTKFYELDDDSMDVLVLGTSRAFEDINTGTLWDEYGMASFILGGSVQPLWNTYYYLKEALKTQTPEVIVLEGYMTTYDKEYMDDSRIIKNTFGLRWSVDKVKSIMASAPKERWGEFLLGYCQYHTRYSELSDADFLPNQNNRLYDNWKGFGCNMATNVMEFNPVATDEKISLNDKTLKYYRMIIELAQEKNIPMVIAINPYAEVSEHDEEIFDSAAGIADEYGVPFVDFNHLADEIGLDFSVDAADSIHLNYRGSRKYTSFLGAYLKENFEISDRRGQAGYESWESDARYISRLIENQLIRESEDVKDILEKAAGDGYEVFLSADWDYAWTETEWPDFLEELGVHWDGSGGIWQLEDGQVVWSSGGGEARRYITLPSHDICLMRKLTEDGKYENPVVIDNEVCEKVPNLINVVIYDTVTESVVENFGVTKKGRIVFFDDL